jgi:hypothetical protein
MTTRVELEPEQEVDLGRYATALAARWWLAVLGIVAGAIAGYLLAIGGSDVYRAQALVDLGSPQAPGGGVVENPSSLVTHGREVARSESTVRRVARSVGMRPGELRSGLSVQPVTSAGRAAATTLLAITVRGDSRRSVAAAANALAEAVAAEGASPYVDTKIAELKTLISDAERELQSVDRRLDAALRVASARGASATERLIALSIAGTAEQRHATLLEQVSRRKIELALAENIERPSLVDRASAVKTTARSTRNSAVVGATIGLLLGLIAALAWEPVAAAVARRRE